MVVWVARERAAARSTSTAPAVTANAVAAHAPNLASVNPAVPAPVTVRSVHGPVIANGRAAVTANAPSALAPGLVTVVVATVATTRSM